MGSRLPTAQGAPGAHTQRFTYDDMILLRVLIVKSTVQYAVSFEKIHNLIGLKLNLFCILSDFHACVGLFCQPRHSYIPILGQ